MPALPPRPATVLSLWQKQQKTSGDRAHEPRDSRECAVLSPLVDEKGTNERRYYRSAEFQQALLEQQIEENMTDPIKERAQRRRISFLRYRTSSAASRSSSGHPRVDFTEEPAGPAAGIGSSSPVHNTMPPTSHAKRKRLAEATSSEKSQKHNRPRICLAGIGPLIDFASKN